MQLARIVLLLSALPFAGIGLAFLLVPERMCDLIGVTLAGPTALADIRAVYGGLQLGCAAFLGLAAANPSWTHAGLAGQLALYGGLAGARIVSYALSGLPSGLGLVLHGGELVGLAFGVVAWRSVGRSAE